jgi:4-aminobutyrate aminotransferase-like enzyme
MDDGRQGPEVRTVVPGAQSQRWLEVLGRLENPSISQRRKQREAASGASWQPMVWERARGANVWDADGNRFVDLTAGFGVAAVGHAHPSVVAAGQRQLSQLPHAMGDAFPARAKAQLLERLADLLPGDMRGITLACSGSEAVEIALKGAMLATGRSRFLSFAAGYHGLSIGALQVSGYRPSFRAPFRALIPHADERCAWPIAGDGRAELDALEAALEAAARAGDPVAAVVAEPVLGRGGAHPAPTGFLQGLAERARARGALLILDEVFTGFGRTGRWFGCLHDAVQPDLIAVGKALGGGFPISACAATPAVAAAWGPSTGEAIHTSTFLGNPVGCSMALAVLDVLEREALPERAEALGSALLQRLDELHRAHPEHLGPARGRGLLVAVEVRRAGAPSASATLALARRLLEAGYIVLPCGLSGDAIQLTPPLTVAQAQLEGFCRALERAVLSL